jgi:putative hemolysin
MFTKHKKSLEQGHDNGSKADELKKQIEQSLDLAQASLVKEVMTPRVEVVALEIPVTVDAVLQAIKRSGHSRFPVYHEDLDKLVGVLFLKDLLRDERWWHGIKENSETHNERDKNGLSNGNLTPLQFSRFLRTPYLVPESRPILDVLLEMRQQRRDFAIVIDEHGSVSGVLTIKDILGHIVGELPDEFDAPEPPSIMRVDETRWLIDGSASVDEVSRQLEINIPDGEYVTIGGYVLDTLGDIPKEGDYVNIDGWSLKVVEMDKRRVAKIVAQKLK